MDRVESIPLDPSDTSSVAKLLSESASELKEFRQGFSKHITTSSFSTIAKEEALGGGIALVLAHLQKSMPTLGIALQTTAALGALQTIKQQAKSVNDALDAHKDSSDTRRSPYSTAQRLGEIAGELALNLIGGAAGAKIGSLLNAKHNALKMLSEDPSKNPIVRVDIPNGRISGFAIDNDRLIATNAHPIHNKQYVLVHTADGRLLDSELLAMHPTANLAILRTFQPHNLQAPKLAQTLELLNTERAVNAFGARGGKLNFNMVHAGKSKELTSLENALDTNYAQRSRLEKFLIESKRDEHQQNLPAWTDQSRPIVVSTSKGYSPGMSGGPLIDEKTQSVLGVVTARTMYPTSKPTLLSEPIYKLQELLMLLKRPELGKHSIATYASIRPMNRTEVQQQLFDGRLKGYLLPFSDATEIPKASKIVTL